MLIYGICALLLIACSGCVVELLPSSSIVTKNIQYLEMLRYSDDSPTLEFSCFFGPAILDRCNINVSKRQLTS